mmetsp:Transcript_47219/g.101059  ORF Transcript_47219/g.101059 Transcript_47219/m.101059 type:complete len:211 (+) Transcript_47219:1114-1746(+)
MQLRVKDDIVELGAMGLLEAEKSQEPSAGLAKVAASICFANQGWTAQALVQLFTQQNGHFTSEISTCDAADDRTDGQSQIRRRGVHTLDPIGGNLRCLLDGSQHLGLLLLHLCLHGADVDVLVVPGRFDFGLLLDFRLLDGLLHTHLSSSLIRFQSKLQQFLLALTLRLFLSNVGSFLLLHQFQIQDLLLFHLLGNPGFVQLRTVVLALA